jgi:hypothetical protein
VASQGSAYGQEGGDDDRRLEASLRSVRLAQRLADEFDAYVAKHNISEEDYPVALARWLAM